MEDSIVPAVILIIALSGLSAWTIGYAMGTSESAELACQQAGYEAGERSSSDGKWVIKCWRKTLLDEIK
jgi:putative hemolysin